MDTNTPLPDGFTPFNMNNNKNEKRILIINEEKDQNKEYTFQELIDFSKYLLKRDQSYFQDIRDSISLLSPPPPIVHSDNISSNDNNAIKLSSNLLENFQQERLNFKIPNKTNDDDNNNKKDNDNNNNKNNDNSSYDSFICTGADSKNNKNDIYWIDMEGLEDEEISMICKLFSIHHLTYEDITSQDSSEKSEEYSHYLFVSTSEISYNNYNVLETSNIYLVIFKSFVLVFHSRPIDSFEAVMKSFRYLENNQIHSPFWVLCSFLDAIHGIYSGLADTLMVEVNILDEYTMRDEVGKSELYIRLGRAVRKATNLLSWLFIKNDVMSSLLRDNINDSEAKRHLTNIKDRLQRLQQKIKLAEELLENIGNICISKVSLVMDEESHTLNKSMSRIATLTTIFMPLSWIAGIFGMNIKLPGLASEIDSFAYFSGIVVFMFVFAVICILYSVRKGFL